MAQAIASGKVIEQYGPYGSQLPENYRVQLADGERFTKVSVEHGYVVDAFKFEIAKPDGTTRTEWVGYGSPPTETHHISQIVLQDGEYLTKFSGKFGTDVPRNQFGIATLKIHTNFNRAGYGPYGLGGWGMDNLTDFSSPDITDGPVVGVFGRHHIALNSVGVFVRKEFSALKG
ncbi:protein GOS9 [Beta vulgaris subsp. vulgaris]|uniref:protein GOS9 n=1 Tax=Beta vulgaris subsp. vulgaris TaxID=3555 RepID=UPI0020374D87|nr:protein GOS9 [Beta vulgaris subsp. vulgaris]